MVSAATKRKRRERQNRTAEAIEQSRQDVETEQRALGTAISENVPNVALFQEDRKGAKKEALAEKYAQDGREQRLAWRRARRQIPTVRRSEMAAEATVPMEAVKFAGGKKKRDIASVEKAILKKRKFDKPEGHIGNRSAKLRAAKRFVTGKEDVWTSETAVQVDKEISQSRKELVRKMTRRLRNSYAIVYPDAGLSVNPSYEHHQDKLGEALAKTVMEEDRKKWNEKKLSFDPAILKESEENVDALTGMRIDSLNEEKDSGSANAPAVDDEGEESDDGNKAVPERKTRSERNKEARKREMVSQIAKKRKDQRRREDLMKIEEVAQEALEEANKRNGVTKKLLKKQRVSAPGKKKDRPVFMRIAGQRVRKESVAEPFVLSEDLSESLRGVRVPNGNPLMTDRMLSFERRGMLEPPKVIPKELWRIEQERRQDELRDKTKRRGKHSRSNISYWKEKSKKK